MIALPDTRPLRKPEYEGIDCGLVCAQCVMVYHDIPLTFADRLIPKPKVGIPPRELINAFLLSGRPVAHGTWGIDSLKKLRNPFIAYVNAVDGIDHYVVVRGVQRNRVYFFDPDDGMISQSVPIFMSRWHSIGPRNQLIVNGGILIQ